MSMATHIERHRIAINPSLGAPDNLTALVKSAAADYRANMRKARVRVPEGFRKALVAHYKDDLNRQMTGLGDTASKYADKYKDLTWAGMRVLVDDSLHGEVAFDEFLPATTPTVIV